MNKTRYNVFIKPPIQVWALSTQQVTSPCSKYEVEVAGKQLTIKSIRELLQHIVH